MSRFDVAVFPLPNAVLFPGVTLPLHLLEERYLQMIMDVQAKKWPLAVSLLVPEGINAGAIRLNSICGAGIVELFRSHADGSSDILVHGTQRVKLISVVQKEPYYVMEAERIEPEHDPSRAHLERKLAEFKALLKAWTFLHPKISPQVSFVFEEFKDIGELVDFFTFHFIKSVKTQQRFLDCPRPLERAQRLARVLEKDLLKFSHGVTQGKNFRLLH